jgi:hypothetical protein
MIKIFFHHRFFLLSLTASIIIVACAVPAMAATTQIHIVKYAGDGATILSEKTITYQEMENSLPVLGDGLTHYYNQGPVFIDDPDPVSQERLRWNPKEDTNAYPEKDLGAVKGTDLKDLCNLVGGMSSGDTVKIKASDGFTREFAYKNVYTPPPRQGPMVITWYKDGQYPDSGYSDGMKLVFFADTSVNPWGAHVFGNFDWYESSDQQYWYFYQNGDQKYPTTTGLSAKYVSDILIYSSLPVSGSSGGNWGWSSSVPLTAGAAPSGDALRFGYMGSKLTTYTSGTINGSIRLILDPNSTSVVVNNRIREYSLPFELPQRSNLTLARLYVYISKSHGIQSIQGVVPSLFTSFNRMRIDPDRVYIDTDGDEHRNVSATFAYDVLENLRGNGTYTVSLRNLDFDQYVFSVDGVMLLVAYENEEGNQSQYWITEGCDVIFSDLIHGIFPKDAVTSIAFGGPVNMTETSSADLILVSTNLDTLNSTEHGITFNNGTWFNSFDNLTQTDILRIPVLPFLNASGNSATIKSTIRTRDADYLINRIGILVIEHNLSDKSVTGQSLRNLPDLARIVNNSLILNANPQPDTKPACRLTLHSDPEGALIYVDGIYQGKTTPSIVEMNSSDQRRIRLELDGFVPVERDLNITNDTTVCEHLYSDVYSTKWRSEDLVLERDKTHNGGLFINSRPKPALISLNGVQLSQRTPAVISGLKEGTYTVSLSFDQADPFMREKAEIKFQDQEVYVHPYCIEPVDVVANTSPLFEIIIDSRDLRGEPFTVNGRVNEKSIPDTITTPLFDSFITVFHNMSYVSYSLPSTLNDDHYLIIQPRKYHDLNVFVDSRPRGAEVFIDGFRTGLSTPYSFTNISDGPHRIMVSKPGYIPQESAINLLYTQVPIPTNNISFTLEEYPSGFLRVTSTPHGATIILDGSDTGEITPFIFSSIPSGSHSVEVTLNKTSSKFPEITVNAVEVTKINADFT